MKIVLTFQYGSQSFRFVPGGRIEVQGVDGLGEPNWIPAATPYSAPVLLEKALQRMTAAWSARVHGERPDERDITRDERGRVVIDIGKVS